LLAYLNVHNLIFLSMVHEYAYKTYEYISKLANWCCASRTGASVQHRSQPMPAHMGFIYCSHAATRSSSLQYNGLH